MNICYCGLILSYKKHWSDFTGTKPRIAFCKSCGRNKYHFKYDLEKPSYNLTQIIKRNWRSRNYKRNENYQYKFNYENLFYNAGKKIKNEEDAELVGKM